MAVLVALFLLGLLVSLPRIADRTSYVVIALVSSTAIALMGVVVALLLRNGQRPLAGLRAVCERVPLLDPIAVDRLARTLAGRVQDLGRDRRLLLRTTGWALGNWLFDAACLWTCLRAYGYSESPGPLLAAYGVANLLAFLPLTPGGLGVVEGVLVPALVSFGAPSSLALLGVITWRLGEYLLPILVALLAYVSLRVGPLRPSEAPATAPPATVVVR